MGLTESQMLSFLGDTDLSEDTKSAICNLIKANNKQVEKEIPKISATGIMDGMRKRGK